VRSRVARTREPDLKTLTIDGVRVFFREVPGPLRGGLMFRVGKADERLAQHGLSHLVEHLTLTDTPEKAHPFNAFTGPTLTSFVTVGAPEEVSEFFTGVCARLGDPRMDRLEHEREVLRAEAAQRPRGPLSNQVLWRWGPEGFGVPAYDEWGILDADEAVVRAWIARHFHRDNCVLWLTGPPPASLRLQLAEGPPAAAMPDPTQAVVSLPAAYGGQTSDVLFSVLAPRTVASIAFANILASRLNSELRHDKPLSYGVNTDALPLNGDHSLWSFAIDARPEQASAVQDGVCRVVTEIGFRKPEKAEVDRAKASAVLAMQDPNAVVGHLEAWARATLMGHKPQTIAELTKEWEALTPAKILDVAKVAMPTLLMQAPRPNEVPSIVAEPSSPWSVPRFSGSIVRPSPGTPLHGEAKLHVAREGLTLAFNDVERFSIPTEDCIAVARYDDDSSVVFGRDGVTIAVAADEWDNIRPVTKWADALPEGAVFSAGARTRPAEDGDKPAARRMASRTSHPVLRRRPSLAGFGVFAMVAALLIVLRLPAPDSSESSSPFPPGLTFGVPDRIATGQCLLDVPESSSSTLITMGCDELHAAEVLYDSFTPTGSKSGDTRRCEELWPSGRAHYLEYRVLPYVDDAIGEPRLLCLLVPAGGGMSVGSMH
jgi:predicted Zn-dependent peptidase